MGNRNSLSSTITKTRHHQYHVASFDSTSTPPLSSTHVNYADQENVISQSTNVEEHCVRFSPDSRHPGSQAPLKPLDYHESFQHLRELAQKQLGETSAVDGIFSPSYAMYDSCNNRSRSTCDRRVKPKCLNDSWTRTEETQRRGHEQPDTKIVGPNSYGDEQSPKWVEYGSSMISEDGPTYINHITQKNRVQTPNIQTNACSTPYDPVAKTGDENSPISACSRASEDGLENSRPTQPRKTNTTRSIPKSKQHSSIVPRDTPSKSNTVPPTYRNVRTAPMRTSQHSRGDSVSRGDIGFMSPTSMIDTNRPYSSCRNDYSGNQQVHSQSVKYATPHLGFQTQPDGTVTYTAFLRSGPCGVPSDGWLTDLEKRAARYLAGLRRQYRCVVRFDQRLVPYRGLFVHAFTIHGQSQSDLIRFRNTLPACLEKHMITPYALHGPTLRRSR